MPSLGDLCTPERAEPLFAEAVPLLWLPSSLLWLGGLRFRGPDRPLKVYTMQHVFSLSILYA